MDGYIIKKNKKGDECCYKDNKKQKTIKKTNTKEKPKKSCKKVSATRCSPHTGPMDDDCELSDKNRCVIKKSGIVKKSLQKAQSLFESGKKNIMDRVLYIDKCFMEIAPRNQDDTVVYFRGMKGDYGHKKIGDEIVVSNYTSISISPTVPFYFY